jgi:hypothetical protein
MLTLLKSLSCENARSAEAIVKTTKREIWRTVPLWKSATLYMRSNNLKRQFEQKISVEPNDIEERPGKRRRHERGYQTLAS